MPPPLATDTQTPLPSKHSNLPFLPLSDSLDVSILRGIQDLRSAGKFICLDDQGTKRRDDAYLFKRESPDRYRLFIAISPISIHTKFSWNHLKGYIPFETVKDSEMFSTRGPESNYTLGIGEGEALVFDITTDLSEINDVTLYRSQINSMPYFHPWKSVKQNGRRFKRLVEESVRIPQYLEDEFLTVTGSETTRDGVAKLMRMQNALSARALIAHDVSGIFDSYDSHGRLHLTHNADEAVVAAKASSPIRLSIDRINSAQVASLLRTKQDAFSPDLCAQLCAAAAKGYRGHRAA